MTTRSCNITSDKFRTRKLPCGAVASLNVSLRSAPYRRFPSRATVPILRSFLAALLVGSTLCRAQTSSVRRDTQAIAVLTAVQTATGWGNLVAIKDATVVGTITYNKPTGDTTSNYQLRAMPQGRVREDIGNDINVKRGSQVSERRDGKSTILRSHMAPSRIPIAFPFWTSLESWQQPDTELKYDGSKVVDDDTVDIVEVTSLPATKGVSAIDRRLVTQVFYVSRSTHLPIKIVFLQPAPYSPFARFPITYLWAGYQPFNGLLIPTKIVAKAVDNKQFYEVDVQSVTVNSGLVDSTFDQPN